MNIVIKTQVRAQETLIGDLRHKIRNCRDADYEVKLHAMLAHALVGLAALCQDTKKEE